MASYDARRVQEVLSEIEDGVRPVQKSMLPRGVAGFVNMNTRQGVYGEDFQDSFRENTRHHEIAHALGIRDEYQADLYALSKTGKTEYVRGPFYRPPINLN